MNTFTALCVLLGAISSRAIPIPNGNTAPLQASGFGNNGFNAPPSGLIVPDHLLNGGSGASAPSKGLGALASPIAGALPIAIPAAGIVPADNLVSGVNFNAALGKTPSVSFNAGAAKSPTASFNGDGSDCELDSAAANSGLSIQPIVKNVDDVISVALESAKRQHSGSAVSEGAKAVHGAGSHLGDNDGSDAASSASAAIAGAGAGSATSATVTSTSVSTSSASQTAGDSAPAASTSSSTTSVSSSSASGSTAAGSGSSASASAAATR